MSTNQWSRGDRIALISLLVAGLACIAAIIVIPEVRVWLGLEMPAPTSSPRETTVKPTPEISKGLNSGNASANPSSNSSRPSIPKVEGAVGHLKGGKEFVDFIYSNENKIVFLDIYIPEEEFEGNVNEPNSYFVIFDECDGLLPNEKPSTSKCTGIEYNINNSGQSTDYSFYYSRGVYKLHGYFAITGVDGPHQGLMGVGMKPLNYESVAPGILR
jgi:hypothetical protein